MKDLTETAPIRRMTVARGTLAGAAASEADKAHAAAAATLAVKGAGHVIPDLHPVGPTHVDVLWSACAAEAEAEVGPAGAEHSHAGNIAVTITVQGHSRSDLDGMALYGVAVALLSLRERVGGTVADMHVVQRVP